jgi:hypothetical protein
LGCRSGAKEGDCWAKVWGAVAWYCEHILSPVSGIMN